MSDSEAYTEYVNAAIALATSVDVADRMANDPSAPGDRSPAAAAARAQILNVDLARYRAAKAAFDAALAAPQEPEPAAERTPIVWDTDAAGNPAPTNVQGVW